jgi:xanthine dehydrogenase accessory factor
LENLDLLVLRTLLEWRKAGKEALLATVIRTWGSSPRPVGSIMALSEDGHVVGSVSGGCIEDDLIRKNAYQKPFPSGLPQMVVYGVTADEAHKFGLPCGGTIELLNEYSPDIALIEELITKVSAGQLAKRILNLKTGVVTIEPTDAPAELQLDDSQMVNVFGPEYRMLIIGAGQLSEYVATMALFNGFEVTVCDPRDEYRAGWSVPNVKLTTEMPDDVVLSMKLDPRSCVVALTHDPKLDDMALLEALNTDAFYIGAIGSRRNNEARRARLIEYFGFTSENLEKLRGPIGIYIGSKTPSEIAVSVMAEILAVKNKIPLPREANVEVAKNIYQPESAISSVSCAVNPKPV